MQAYREVDCDKNEKVNNMDYMFKTEGDVDVAVDVFAEYGGMLLLLEFKIFEISIFLY